MASVSSAFIEGIRNASDATTPRWPSIERPTYLYAVAPSGREEAQRDGLARRRRRSRRSVNAGVREAQAWPAHAGGRASISRAPGISVDGTAPSVREIVEVRACLALARLDQDPVAPGRARRGHACGRRARGDDRAARSRRRGRRSARRSRRSCLADRERRRGGVTWATWRRRSCPTAAHHLDDERAFDLDLVGVHLRRALHHPRSSCSPPSPPSAPRVRTGANRTAPANTAGDRRAALSGERGGGERRRSNSAAAPARRRDSPGAVRRAHGRQGAPAPTWARTPARARKPVRAGRARSGGGGARRPPAPAARWALTDSRIDSSTSVSLPIWMRSPTRRLHLLMLCPFTSEPGPLPRSMSVTDSRETTSR